MRRMQHPDVPGTAGDQPVHRTGVLPFQTHSAASQPTPDVSAVPDTSHEAAVALWKHLQAAHWAELVAFANPYVEPGAGEDIVAEAFIALWYRYLEDPKRPPHRNWRKLLFKIVYDEVRNARRARTRFRRNFAGYVHYLKDRLPRWMSPDAEVDGYARAIDKAYDQMTPRTAEIHRLHYQVGYTYLEVAELCGIGAETVKTMLQKGNLVMRQALERAGYSPAMRRAIAAGKRGTR